MKNLKNNWKIFKLKGECMERLSDILSCVSWSEPIGYLLYKNFPQMKISYACCYIWIWYFFCVWSEVVPWKSHTCSEHQKRLRKSWWLLVVFPAVLLPLAYPRLRLKFTCNIWFSVSSKLEMVTWSRWCEELNFFWEGEHAESTLGLE